MSDQGAPAREVATERPHRPTQRGALFLEIFAGNKIFFATFDSCVYGGARRKATTCWSSAETVESLTLRVIRALATGTNPGAGRAQPGPQPRRRRD